MVNFLKLDESIITITGYESSALAARDAILKIVNDYVSKVFFLSLLFAID